MSEDLISRSALLDYCGAKAFNALELWDGGMTREAWLEAFEAVKNAPAVDAVPLKVVEQFKWERDIAIGQLEELGIGFGQKKPDMVEVVRCRDCLNAMKMPEVVREHFGYREDALDCGMGYGVVLPDDYCSKGCKADAEVEDGR